MRAVEADGGRQWAGRPQTADFEAIEGRDVSAVVSNETGPSSIFRI